jgi:hypothetical protein
MAPEIVASESMEGQVRQASVLGVTDPVLTPGAEAVADLQIGQLALCLVRRYGRVPVPVDVRDPQLGADVRDFLADDDRIPAGREDRSSTPVMSATHAPSRSTPSLSYALVHPSLGTSGRTSATVPWFGNPTE